MSWLEDQLRADLQQRRDRHLLRSLRSLSPHVLDLASNDYLGLARHPRVIEEACRATQQWGGGARASRLLGGHTPVHTALEAKLAAFKDCEAALVFPSGYAANIGVINALADGESAIFCDKRNHASLIDACRLAHSNGATVRYYGSLDKLQQLLAKAPTARRLIVTDTVFSMDGDVADLPALIELATRYEAILVLDDAHGTGTLGRGGQGALKSFYATTIPDSCPIVQIGTLSKALGSQGGFVVGTQVLIDWLVSNARPFIYTTGINPAACGAALAALEVLEAEPQRVTRLREVAQRLATGLQELELQAKLQPSPIIPVFIGEAEAALQWSQTLLECGLWCPAVRPPTVPVGTSRLRVTASSSLSDDDIEHALQIFRQARDRIS